MPIRLEHRWLYPIDWPQLSARIRFGCAEGRCEHCRRPHARAVQHLGDGRWWDETSASWRNDTGRRVPTPPEELASRVRVTRLVLACAHLNHDPTDNRPRNLAALCQRCHLRHDAPEHRRRRFLNAFRLRAWRDLFDPRFVN